MRLVKKLLMLSFLFLLIFQNLGSVGYAGNIKSSSPNNVSIESKEIPQSSKEDEPQTLTGIKQSEQIETKTRSEEHTSELQSRGHLVCRLLLEKKKHRDDSTKRITTRNVIAQACY